MKREFAPITKITRPAISGISPRRRLFDILSSSHDQQAIWVSGPAGAGKTTLVASYLDDSNLPCLWYQADADDGDISTFFYYLGLAAKHAAPRYRKSLPLLTPEYLQAVPTFTRRYFENLYARLRTPFAVVFDNYQEAPLNSAFHDVIREAIAIVPAGITFILISRGEPPRSLAGLRANNKVFVIGWDELRFTLEESGEIVKKRGQVALPGEILAQFHTRTDGWAAGLVLMSEVYKTRGVNVHGPSASAPREIFDYFAGEILDKLDGETRDFLLRTSLFPTMTVMMANQLTSHDNAGRILSTLNRTHLFTKRHASTHSTYQYHPLFREFLLARLKKNLSRENVLRLQKRAAVLLDEAGQIEEAASVCRDAHDGDMLAWLVVNHAQSLLSQGRSATLADWLAGIPEGLLDRRPWLLYWQAVCQTPVDPVRSRAIFEKAFRIFEDEGEAAGTLLAWAGAVNTFMYDWNDFRPLDPLIGWLDLRMRVSPAFPSPEIETSVACSMIGALLFRQPAREDRAVWVERALKGSRAIDDPELRMQACFYAFNHYLWAGDIARCGIMAEEIEVHAKTLAASPLAAINSKSVTALYCAWASADHEKALAHVKEGLKIAQSTGVHVWDHMLYASGVYAAIGGGDGTSAENYLFKLEQLAKNAGGFALAHYNHLASWYHLIFGSGIRSLAHAETALKLSGEPGACYFEMLCRIKLAVVLHEVGEVRRAGVELSHATRMVRTAGSASLEFMVLAADALFVLKAGKEAEGLKALRQAMELGRKQGYVNMFWWWQPSVMAFLCLQALDHGIEVEYSQNLIRSRGLVPDSPPVHCGDWPWAVKVFTLGRFGIERNGKPVRFSKKVPKKPLEMLRVLVALGGQNVTETRLNDLLWPDADGDSAHRAFNITLIRLREIIGPKEALELRDGCVNLDKHYVWIDAWALEHQLDQAALALRGASFAPDLFDRAIDLYKGQFLSDENGAWAISRRERLKGRVMSLVENLGKLWEGEKSFMKALDCYQRGLEIDDLAEEFYRRAILCFLKLGRRAEAHSLYRKCEKILGSYGIKPSSDTETIFKSLISG